MPKHFHIRVGSALLSIAVEDQVSSPPPSSLASVQVTNFGGSTLPAGTPVRFAHVFGAADVPSGSSLSLDIGGTAVPATFARRASGTGTSLRCADILALLPASLAAAGTATINLSAVPSSSFDDALPAGKTVANIVADITANHDAIGVTLEGLTNSAGTTEGSGTWIADSTTAFDLATTHGGYRCTATGPTAADFTVWMKLRDNTGGAEHAGLWAQFYITAFLDTTTGAVTKLCSRAWLNQGRRDVANDKYRYSGKLKVGASAVRSWGYASDGRSQAFAPSAVNTSDGRITVAGHGFIQGDLVRLTTAGTLPAGFSLATDYWAVVDDTNTIHLAASQDSAISGGSPFIPSNQGSGTHTVTGYVHHCFAQRHCWADRTGLWDWHSGVAGALATRPTWHVTHNKVYCRATKMCPPLDFSYDFAAPSEAAPSSYAPGNFGRMNPVYDTGGANISYGAPWNEWAARAYRYRNDRTGYVQTARVHALMKGMSSVHYIRDDATWRIPCVNNGSDGAGTAYGGLGTPLPGSYTFIGMRGSTHSADFIAPTSSNTNAWTSYDFTHHYTTQYGVYVFEGGRDLLDLMYSDANAALIAKDGTETYNGTTGTLSLDRKLVDGASAFYSACPSSEPRADAWKVNCLTDAAAVGADADAEKSYLADVLRDTTAAINSCIHTWGDATWRACGGWDTSETQRGGIFKADATNSECTTLFFQDYLMMAWNFAFMRNPSATMQAAVDQLCTLMSNIWVNSNCHAYGNTYNIKIKEAPGLSVSPDARLHSALSDFGVVDSNTDGIVWKADGTVRRLDNGGFTPVVYQAGDRVFLSDTVDVVTAYHNGVPPEFNKYAWYFVRQPDNVHFTFKLATTNSDATIITSATIAQSASTLAAGITSGQTSITTAGTLSITSNLRLIQVGSELMLVTGGLGTTTLAVTRGMYGTAAASAVGGVTVSVLWTANYWADLPNRSGGCPTTIYRHYPGAAGIVQFGYLTMARAGMGYAAVAGRMSATGFNTADAYFQAESGPPGSSDNGPQGLIDQNSIMHTAVASV